MTIGKLSLALDLNHDEALALAQNLSGVVPGMKVGMTLFTQSGPEFVRKLVELDYEVFLDLKYHDIPHQVGSAVKQACDLGVRMLTVHTSGGRAMMEAAAKAAETYDVAVVGVSVLTSLGREALGEVGVRGPLEAVVDQRARLAQECGLSGVVASANELRLLRDEYPSPFLIVTPGIRPAGVDVGDQNRVATPEQALTRGADVLVIGRPITQAADPVGTAEALMQIIGRG